jgi:hypothetical protein
MVRLYIDVSAPKSSWYYLVSQVDGKLIVKIVKPIKYLDESKKMRSAFDVKATY